MSISENREIKMSKKRSFKEDWCIPFFDDEPPKRKPIYSKVHNVNIMEDMDETLFDFAMDDLDTKNNQNNAQKLYNNDTRLNYASKNEFNLSKVMQVCEPKISSELALSRQKQNEISNWLSVNGSHGKPSILVISGPAGCGKTVAFKVLAEEHDCHISEWITPVDQIIDENGRIMRQGDRFLEFILRASRYNNIFDNSRKMLLVKDLPNIYLDDHAGFFSMLEKYIVYGKDPLVFICTDGGNSRILTTLFAQQIREKYNIHHININATTQTQLKNMLARISKILNNEYNTFLNVTQKAIDEIMANNIGDIRSALLNLIFLSLKVPNLNKTKSECGSREEFLGLLHGIGRVINPKRIMEGNSWKFTHDPDEMAVYFRTHARTFSYFLHENYMNTMRNIEDVELASDILSLADLLNAEWKDPTINLVTLSLCIRGVMVANENPVTGWNPVRKPFNKDIDVKRNFEQAELKWYESIIQRGKPPKDAVSTNKEFEGIIETD